jgi:hypothetical protein
MCLLLSALVGCQYIPTVNQKELGAAYVKKSEAEARLIAEKEIFNKALTENLTQLSKAKDTVISGQDTQIQAGANSLYAITQVSQLIPAPGSVELVKDRSIEGFAAMGKPPTIKEIVEGQERQRKYLASYKDNNQVEIEKLRNAHALVVAENGLLVKTTEEAKLEVKKVVIEKAKLEEQHVVVVEKTRAEIDAANNMIIAKEKQRAQIAEQVAAKAESVARLKRQLMLWCGIGAVLALAGAIYLPFGKSGLATIAGCLAAATVAIPFITAAMIWIVLIVTGVVAAGIGGVLFYRHNLAEKTNTNLVNAIEDTSQKTDATVKDLKANLKDWNTTYVKTKTGEVITKVDSAVEKYIEEKLMESGRLDPNKKP